MPSASFIISEYNPFHNGHLYHINKTKEITNNTVICIMSGNYVQRGEPAYFNKHLRAKAALLNGADLVLELPLKYAVSDAAAFARGAVRVAELTGITGFLSFGACAEIDELNSIAFELNSSEVKAKIEDICKTTGKSFPSAQGSFIKSKHGESFAKLLCDGNNTLAVCYINELINQHSAIKPLCIKRDECERHDGEYTSLNTASAKFIRSLISKEESFCEFVPKSAYELYCEAIKNGNSPYSTNKYNIAVMSRLIALQNDDFIKLHNVNQGLENRFCEAIKSSRNLEDLYSNVKVKRFTHSRIRQIALSAALGVTKEDVLSDVSFVRVLGFNSKGREMLRYIKDNTKVPFIENISQALSSKELYRDAYLDVTSSRFYELIKPNAFTPDFELKAKPVIV